MKTTRPITRLDNPIQEYAWGSRTFIAELLGRPVPSPAPWAELWMGAHPKAPSRLIPDGISLSAAILEDPENILGADCARQFSNQLPFLFKVLSAAEPLSIQAHPNQAQAEAGFAAENAAGLSLSSPRRNYRDASHKPELITALTPFEALCGFRPIDQSLALLQAVSGSGLQETLQELQQSGLARFLEKLLTLKDVERQTVIAQAVARAGIHSGDPAFGWVLRLQQFYPEDIGILAPLFLNLILLEPPQALFLPAGVLHAYLKGSAIEIMANSDNVIRGGLTPKHVDGPELLRTLSFSGVIPEVLLPVSGSGQQLYCQYQTPAREFRLGRIATEQEAAIVLPPSQVRILLCTAGRFRLDAGEQAVTLHKGDSLLLPATIPAVTLMGTGTCYEAGVPEA